ncbi:MAG: hypothetical protein IT176_09885 [Acidobacteria bacterium]|nr:hypothetical protein [Acidobacteriota bacterium]
MIEPTPRRLLLLLMLVASAGAPARADEVLDRVLAVVGDHMITLTDVTAARDFGLVDAPAGADLVREILPRLIDRELMLVEVDRYAPPEPGVEALDAAMGAARARFASEEAFERALERSGINAGRLRETLRQNLRIDAYLDQRFTRGRTAQIVQDWIDGLRRRTEIVDLSITAR